MGKYYVIDTSVHTEKEIENMLNSPDENGNEKTISQVVGDKIIMYSELKPKKIKLTGETKIPAPAPIGPGARTIDGPLPG